MTRPGSAAAVTIACAGDLMVDVLAQLPGPLATGSDTAAPIRVTGGGAAANVAAWAVVAGARASFVGRVGDDALGRQAVAELAAAGIETRVVTDPTLPTGTTIVLVDPAAERTMIPSAGANESARQPQLPDDADWLYLSGYALLRAATRDWAVATLAVARERGWSIAVDAASAVPLAALGAERFLELVPTEAVLLANQDEARVLTGLADPRQAVLALAARTGAAVVKCGPAGVIWSAGEESAGEQPVAVPAVATEVVDTTGAGDAFAAGFMVAGGDGLDALRAGVRLAARAVGQAGARPPAHLV